MAPSLRARRSRKTALNAEAVFYADSSALVKLVIEEPESEALDAYLADRGSALATSRIAVVEVARATGVANPSPEAAEEARRLLASCLMIDVTSGILRSAARLASRAVRTLDAVHLASAQWIEPDEVIAYDRRLLEAAKLVGLPVSHPGVRE